MKHVWIGLALVAGLGLMDLGCKDACQSAADRINSRLKECDFVVSSTATPASAECSSADAAYEDCRADCAESASCAALHATDKQAAADYNQCNLDCK